MLYDYFFLRWVEGQDGEHKLHNYPYNLPLAEEENKFLNNKIKLEKF